MLLLPLLPALLAAAPADGSARLVAAARAQVGVTLRYDPAYVRLAYPGGDVPLDRGVCTDVVVRAYRALGADLQVLVHRDMRSAWEAYPRTWGLKGPDPSIDHRRVPNLATFLRRRGAALPVTADPADYRPGDLVTWRLMSGVPHIGIVSDRRAPSGRPLVLHNLGGGAKEEDALFDHAVTGHFRWLPGD
ncbi:MAG: DUF1287 domain-containing protein [Holophagaceae bacterium]